MSNSSEPAPNPYKAPMVEATAVDVATKVNDPNSIMAIAKRTFIAWEKLRLLYLLICGIVTFASAYFSRVSFGAIEFFAAIIVGGVFANVCYFAAPVVETYMSWIGLKSQAIRISLFVVGTLITCFGAAVTLSGL